ncbi:MAG: winged helix-turn-helix domain-containing protein [Promethearchaeota archaeon]
MQSRYRNKQTIIADILQSTNRRKGITKTNIIQSANLSWTMFKRYLDILVSNGYILTEGRAYKPTKKGYAFLESMRSDIKGTKCK